MVWRGGAQKGQHTLYLEALGDWVAPGHLGEAEILGKCLLPGGSLGCSAEWPWEVAILGGPGRDEQAIEGEARVSFQGYVCLCLGRGIGQGMEQVWEKGEGLGEI